MTTDEEERIDNQIKEAQSKVDKEIEEFEEQKRRWQEDDAKNRKPDSVKSEEKVKSEENDGAASEQAVQDPAIKTEELVGSQQHATNPSPPRQNGDDTDTGDKVPEESNVEAVENNDTQDAKAEQSPGHQVDGAHDSYDDTKENHDDPEEMVVEAGEDTVIY